MKSNIAVSSALLLAIILLSLCTSSSSVEAFCTTIVKKTTTTTTTATTIVRLPILLSPNSTTKMTARSLANLNRAQEVVLRASNADDCDDDDTDGKNASVNNEGIGLPPLPSSQRLAKDEEGEVGAKAVSVGTISSSSSPTATEKKDGGTTSTVTPATKSYPIDLPSPILLATSMLLAIASIGSIFELAGGGGGYSSSTSTTLGFGPTAAIAAVGLPLSVFLIYAAILKGAAETEEDDARYNSQNNNRRRY